MNKKANYCHKCQKHTGKKDSDQTENHLRGRIIYRCKCGEKWWWYFPH